MNFRPTKLKVLISIIVIIALYIIMVMTGSYAVCEIECLQDFSYSDCPMSIPLFQEYGCCSCPTILPFDEMLVIILILLIPGILTYIIWSLVQNKEVGDKKRR